MESLERVAAEAHELLSRVLVLDPLGDHGEAQAVGELDDRAKDRLGMGPVHVRDERAVDLQGVERQPAEARERRIADAEVVDHDHADAQAPDGLDRLPDRLVRRAERGLGDFDVEPVGRHAEPFQDAADVIGESRRPQRRGREVDRDPDRRPLRVLLRPGRGELERVERELADRGEVTLGRRDEGAGLDQAAPRVLPAHERFEREHLARRDVHDRLVVHDELVARDRPVQAAPQRLALRVEVADHPVRVEAAHEAEGEQRERLVDVLERVKARGGGGPGDMRRRREQRREEAGPRAEHHRQGDHRDEREEHHAVDVVRREEPQDGDADEPPDGDGGKDQRVGAKETHRSSAAGPARARRRASATLPAAYDLIATLTVAPSFV